MGNSESDTQAGARKLATESRRMQAHVRVGEATLARLAGELEAAKARGASQVQLRAKASLLLSAEEDYNRNVKFLEQTTALLSTVRTQASAQAYSESVASITATLREQPVVDAPAVVGELLAETKQIQSTYRTLSENVGDVNERERRLQELMQPSAAAVAAPLPQPVAVAVGGGPPRAASDVDHELLKRVAARRRG